MFKRWLFYAALALLQVGDVLSTNRAKAMGSFEVNPLMRWAQATLGAYWWLPKVGVIVVLAALIAAHRGRFPTRLATAICIFYVIVVANNILGVG